MGAPIFGIGRLIQSNCVVDVQSSTVSIAGGGTVETFAVLAAAVDVLATQFNDEKKGNFRTDAPRSDFTVTGVDPSLNRGDIRLRVVSHESLPLLVGKYLRINSSTGHPAGEGGLLTARVTLKCTLLSLPAQIT